MKRLVCFLLVLCLVLPVSANAAAYSERDQLASFMEYMNEKAAAIGMVSSKFNDPMGGYNFTTARDFSRLLAWVDQYWELMRVFGAEERELSVSGENPRPQTVTSTIRGNEHLDPYYEILACKDGELPVEEIRNLAVILQIPESPDRLAVVCLLAQGRNHQTNGSRAAVKAIADAALRRLADPEADISDIKIPCGSAMAVLLPEEGADPENLRILYEKDPDRQVMTASITKVLTAVCVLDVQQDLEERFDYRSFDTNIGGFYIQDFLPGDQLTYREGLYALLLPSSNVTARALARASGLRILEQGKPDPTRIPRVKTGQGMEGAVAALMISACAVQSK